MDRDSIGRSCGRPRSVAAPSRGDCAIAPVRGDVTTVRAAAAVRARQRVPDATERSRAAPAVAPDTFPAHLLGVGPA